MLTAAQLRLAAVVPFLVASAACSGTDDTGTSQSEAIARSNVISRGMEWVNAKLHYCQASRGAVDYDSACWAWEGSSHRCDRESNSAWNAYRSDCSGFVTFAWGLPPVGDGGYVTGDFAPFSNTFSHTVQGWNLQPGDALNKTNNEHIILFKQWINVGHEAEFMEEPGCSSSTPYAHTFTSSVSISGDVVYVAYEGANFYAIRYDGINSTSGGGGTPSATAADSCNKGGGFCTDTLQCDNGHWIIRADDPAACTTVENIQISCSQGGGYCTQTLQCESGHWVPRASDPNPCTSGPGAQ